MKTQLNLGELLRRLGDRRAGWTPELNELVSPVVQIANLGDLVAPMLSARGLAGGNPVTTAGNLPCLQVRARSAGGLQIQNVVALAGGGNTIRFDVRAAPVTLTTSTNLPVTNTGDVPCVSTVEAGDRAGAVLGVTNAITNTTGDIRILEGMYIPPGGSLYLEGFVINILYFWAVSFIEYEAMRAPAL